AVNTEGFGMYLLDGLLDPLVSLGAAAGRAIQGGVITRGRDAEHVAHDSHGERVAMLADPDVFHSDSFAKYAVAFFNISRSSSARLSCWRRRLFSSRSSSSEAFSPQGFGCGANLECQSRRLFSLTP